MKCGSCSGARERPASSVSELETAEELAVVLTRDLQELGGDRHLRVVGPSGPPVGVLPPRSGIRKLEILEGNVGYLELDSVPQLQVSRAAIAGAFAVLKETEALIIDNRNNHGGSPATVALYVSYLMEGAAFVRPSSRRLPLRAHECRKRDGYSLTKACPRRARRSRCTPSGPASLERSEPRLQR